MKVPMLKVRIWDLPTRLFHWALALSVVGLVITGNVGGNAMAWHFRTAAGREVDLVLQAPSGRVVGIEVKASASLTQGDFSGLRELASVAGKGFARGVVLYTGEQLVPFEEHLWAVPLGVLWTA